MCLGRAVTSYFQSKKRNNNPIIIIGKDTRLSCYMFENAFASGVCSQGGKAILTGPLPTPGVAFVTKSMRADAGVMISASHNPYYDNGIKIFDASGNKLPDEVEEELEKLIYNPSLLEINVEQKIGRATRLDEVLGRYIVHVKSAFDSSYSLEGVRIVLDCANGAAYKVAPLVFQELGAEVIPIGTSPNGVNINDQCGSLYPNNCAKKVLEYRADIGICLDGDADRVTVIDKKGSIVNGDKIIGLLAKFLKEKYGQSNEIVGTVMSNMGLEVYLKSLGLGLHRTKVGDRYILEKMGQSSSVLGGEPSGHIIFRNYATTGDGLLASLKILECIKFYKKDLEELVDEIKLYPQVQKSVEVKSKPDFNSLESVQTQLTEIKQKLNGTGRVLLRYSGTEPLARVMIEGEYLDDIEKYSGSLVTILKKR